MNHEKEVKLLENVSTLSLYDKLLGNYSSFLDESLSNYSNVINTLNYLENKNFLTNVEKNYLLRDFTGIYVSKILENSFSKNLFKGISESLGSMKKWVTA